MGASSPIPQLRLWDLKRQSARQAVVGVQMRRLLGGMTRQAREYSMWLSVNSGVWDEISGACGQESLKALASRLGMGSLTSSPRDIILAGLSTVSTYSITWNMLLESTTGATYRNFMAIRHMEDAVNRIAHAAFYRAAYYYRGLSIVELDAICSGNIGSGPTHTFVSLSSNLRTAIEFAFVPSGPLSPLKVVLAIDSHAARALGATPAMYSLASDILDLRSSEEGIHRTFHLWHAHELQANFSPEWPQGSAKTAKCVLTVLETSPKVSRLARELGVPCMPYHDLLSTSAQKA